MSVLVAGAPTLSSADGVLAMLEEPDYSLKGYALQQLATLVDRYWHEIARSIQQMYVQV